jgi:hypothetical protein
VSSHSGVHHLRDTGGRTCGRGRWASRELHRLGKATMRTFNEGRREETGRGLGGQTGEAGPERAPSRRTIQAEAGHSSVGADASQAEAGTNEGAQHPTTSGGDSKWAAGRRWIAKHSVCKNLKPTTRTIRPNLGASSYVVHDVRSQGQGLHGDRGGRQRTLTGTSHPQGDMDYIRELGDRRQWSTGPRSTASAPDACSATGGPG